jgi:hypothetical protein
MSDEITLWFPTKRHGKNEPVWNAIRPTPERTALWPGLTARRGD